MAIAFALTFIYGKRKLVGVEGEENVQEPTNEENLVTSDEKSSEVTITSPLTGQVIPLKDINDDVFSSEMMGKGIAIYPDKQQIIAPADGKITFTSADSKHAYGMLTDNGVEILIHIGIDTVNMNGTGFHSKVSQDQQVKKGDLLGTFTIDEIKKANYDPTVMVIVTNTAAYAEVFSVDEKVIEEGDNLLQLSK